MTVTLFLELENRAPFCHFANPIFVLGTIGYTFLHNKKLGLIIKNGWYVWMLLSIILIFIELTNIASNFYSYQMAVLAEDILFVLAITVISFINLYRIFKTAYVKNIGFLLNLYIFYG